MGKHLVEWLNALPDVQAVLRAQFGGRTLTEQNLSVWKQGGFEDWQRHEEARAWAGLLTKESDDLEREAGKMRLADRAAVPVVVALGQLLQQATTSGDPTEQRKTVLGVAQQLEQVRRGNHEAERVRLEAERWEASQAELRDTKREAEEARAHAAEFKRRYFPHLDENFMPRTPGALPVELQTCLTANDRLRATANGRGGPTESK
ncbi:MAG: hypothetical protein K8R23_01785 [Chthoniobacter sp.]|nr:hypothetical protein [Chthoniobacter sp.]